MEEEQPDTFLNRCRSFWSNHWKGVALATIPFALLPIIFMNWKSKVNRCIYLFCLMTLYWLLKVVPVYITSFFPAMLLPVMGIMSSNETSTLYFDDTVFFFFGNLLMGLALEYCNLHKRLALVVITRVGSSPWRINLVLIFMSMLISMWIPNAATTVMMCSIVRAIVDDLDAQGVIKAYDETVKNKDNQPTASRVASGFFLSVAFAATIGGTGTLLGTGTNFAVKGLYELRFPESEDYINFVMFSIFTLPMVLLLTLFLGLWMHFFFMRNIDANDISKKVGSSNNSLLGSLFKDIGTLTFHEVQVFLLFLIMVILVATIGRNFMSGWSNIFNERPIKYSLPVILIALLLFTIPMHYRFCKYVYGSGPYTAKEVPSLLSSKFALKGVQWGYLFLIGGGLALAQGIIMSSTGKWLMEHLTPLYHCPSWCIQFLCIVAVIVLTAFTWNILACNIMIPLIAEVAVACGIHPLYLVLPSGIAASYSFILPIGTMSNEIVSAYGNIRWKYMFLAGIGPTVMAIFLVFANSQIWYDLVFARNLEFPLWAAMHTWN